EPTDRRQRLQLIAERHKRFALPCACLVFALTGVALGLAVSRGSRSSGLVIGIGVTLSYYLLEIVGENMARQGAIWPALGIWMPNLIVGIFGLLVLTRYQWLMDHFIRLWSYSQPIRRRLSGFFEGERLVTINRVKFGFPRLIDRMIVSDMVRYFF